MDTNINLGNQPKDTDNDQELQDSSKNQVVVNERTADFSSHHNDITHVIHAGPLMPETSIASTETVNSTPAANGVPMMDNQETNQAIGIIETTADAPTTTIQASSATNEPVAIQSDPIQIEPLAKPEENLQPESSDPTEGMFTSRDNGGFDTLVTARSKKPWLAISLSTIGVILLGFGGMVFASEKGMINIGLDKVYNKIGLQKLWNGLPFQSEAALASSAVTMSKITNFHTEGKITINVSVNNESALNAIINDRKNKIALTEKTGKVLGTTTDNKVAISENADPYSNFTLGATMSGDFSQKLWKTRLSLDTSSLTEQLNLFNLGALAKSPLSLDAMEVDGKYYVRIPSLTLIIGGDNNKWVEINKSDLQTAGEENKEEFTLKDIGKYSKAISSGEKVGSETISNVLTNKYSLKINVAKLAELLGEDTSVLSEEINKTTIDAFVWIGQKDHYIHKIQMNSSVKEYGMDTNINLEVIFSKFNESLKIEAPKKSEIAKDGFGEIFQKVSEVVMPSQSEGLNIEQTDPTVIE